MAGETLQDSLSGLRFSGADNSWGLGASTLASSLPALINPRSSVGRNLAIGLGGTLLTALLGYQARQQASEDTIATMGYGNQILGAASPEEQFAIATAVEDTQQKAKLLTLVNALKTNETVNRLNNQVKQADMLRDVEQARLVAVANQDLQLGEQGTEIFNRENQAVQNRALQVQAAMQDRALAVQAAMQAAKPAPSPVAWLEKVPAALRAKFSLAPGVINELKQLATDAREIGLNAIDYNIQKNIPGTPAELHYAKMLALIPQTARLMGEVGNLNISEVDKLIQSTFGSRLSGMESVAKRIDGLTSSATNIVNTQAKIFENMYKPEGGASLSDALMLNRGPYSGGGADVPETPTAQGSQDQEAYRQSLLATARARGLIK